MTTDTHTASSIEDTQAARYTPNKIEAKWQVAWESSGVFDAEVDESKEPYTIVVPPPNVTGSLHMGHALNGSIQDTLIRWKRMSGFNALFLPGVDHAGIATQVKVEQKLRNEGTSRQELGREAFLDHVQEWKDKYAATIHGQFRSLGASMDFRRARFTMDEHYHKAVLQAFVELYNSGYIYRAHRLVNWDAGTMSAISDLEVVNKDVDDEMVQVAYAVVGSEEEIVIATARPETIPADVAVAVHPEDERYKHLVGKRVVVPFTNREVPIIADSYVDIEFGTGALKITPGHDPNDFEIGERHGLEAFSAINPDRTMSDICGEYAGLDVDKARRVMTNALEEMGSLRAREPYRHSVPFSDRSGIRIEPLVSLQWFADISALAKPVVKWVDEGKVRFIPDSSKSIFHSWMDDLKPWCLSRQLWWGHQLPVWYHVDDESKVHVSVDGPPVEEASQWRRDEDVLDTWFSSGMWDHATLGWPDKTAELEYFHPTNVLCTARDIINLWVARMMMFSNEHLGEIPFSDVYIHSTIQAPDGRRMSKSLGTGIDPLELFDKYGTDATRYGLLDMSSTQDVRFNEGRIKEGNQLANKLWNAARLLITFGDVNEFSFVDYEPTDSVHLEDKWILARLDKTLKGVTRAFENYDFSQATKLIYRFCWNDFCDWYLESIKERLRSDEIDIRAGVTRHFCYIMDRIIRLIHPVMPHLSEELFSQTFAGVEQDSKFVATSKWYSELLTTKQLSELQHEVDSYTQLQTLVTRLRGIRQVVGMKPRFVVPARLEVLGGQPDSDVLRLLNSLANVDPLAGHDGVGISIPLGDSTLTLYGIDIADLKPRLEADFKQAKAEVKRAEGKLANERFTSKAPADLVQAERDKIEHYSREAQQLEDVITQL